MCGHGQAQSPLSVTTGYMQGLQQGLDKVQRGLVSFSSVLNNVKRGKSRIRSEYWIEIILMKAKGVYVCVIWVWRPEDTLATVTQEPSS